MANTFLHNEDGLNSSINELKDSLSSYRQNIETLSSLISEMSGSSSWQDEAVKTSFINTASGYLTAYKTFASGIEGYIDCLTKKSNNIVEHENNFAK